MQAGGPGTQKRQKTGIRSHSAWTVTKTSLPDRLTSTFCSGHIPRPWPGRWSLPRDFSCWSSSGLNGTCCLYAGSRQLRRLSAAWTVPGQQLPLLRLPSVRLPVSFAVLLFFSLFPLLFGFFLRLFLLPDFVSDGGFSGHFTGGFIVVLQDKCLFLVRELCSFQFPGQILFAHGLAAAGSQLPGQTHRIVAEVPGLQCFRNLRFFKLPVLRSLPESYKRPAIVRIGCSQIPGAVQCEIRIHRIHSLSDFLCGEFRL